MYGPHPAGTTQAGVDVGRGVWVAATRGVLADVGVAVGGRGVGVGVAGVSSGPGVSVSVGTSSGVEVGTDVGVFVGVLVGMLVAVLVNVLNGGADVDVSPTAMRSLSSCRVITPLPKMVHSNTNAMLNPMANCRIRGIPWSRSDLFRSSLATAIVSR
jgi:hypothetical protein